MKILKIGIGTPLKELQRKKIENNLPSQLPLTIFGFTLIELIVVITILAILGTIAIMAFSGYSKNARDSARISDIANMKKSLELWILQSGTYPEPSNGTGVTYSGATVWTQGTFGESVIQTVGKLEKKPVDPLYNNEYTYSVTNSKKEYQIGAVLERNVAYNNPIIAQTYAATIGEAYVSGTYNGILTTVGTNPTYIIALPSILISDTTITELKNIATNTLVYEGQTNLPSSYKVTGLTMTGTSFSFTPTVVRSGSSITNLNNQAEFQKLVENMQTVYASNTVFTSLPEYANIVSEGEPTVATMSIVKELVQANTSTTLENVSNTYVSYAVNGICGTANGQILGDSSSITGSGACTTGTVSSITGTGPWTWTCNGSSGGINASCGAQVPQEFTGNGTSGSPWIKGDGTALTNCNAYNTTVTKLNDNTVRSTGTCGNGMQQCLSNGVYYIAPDGNQANKFPIYCDMTTEGGGWNLVGVSVDGIAINSFNSNSVDQYGVNYIKPFNNSSGTKLMYECGTSNDGMKGRVIYSGSWSWNNNFNGFTANFTSVPYENVTWIPDIIGYNSPDSDSYWHNHLAYVHYPNIGTTAFINIGSCASPGDPNYCLNSRRAFTCDPQNGILGIGDITWYAGNSGTRYVRFLLK